MRALSQQDWAARCSNTPTHSHAMATASTMGQQIPFFGYFFSLLLVGYFSNFSWFPLYIPSMHGHRSLGNRNTTGARSMGLGRGGFEHIRKMLPLCIVKNRG